MFPFSLDLEPSQDDLQAEEADHEEEPDEWLLFLNDEIAECFELFDKKKIGQFEARYLSKALGCLGLFYTQTELEEVQETLETEGTVTFERFQTFCLEKLQNADAYESLKIAFRAFDPEDEGFISSERFKRWMSTLGDPLTDKEAKELVKMGDPGGKGIIVYDDLASLLLQS